jgi:hypothetical protein
VRGDGLHRLAVVVVYFELFLLIDRIHRSFADDNAFLEHESTEGFAKVGVFADSFGDDVARALEGVPECGDFPFGIDEGSCVVSKWLPGGLLCPEILSKGF